jgi:hypothetical protein
MMEDKAAQNLQANSGSGVAENMIDHIIVSNELADLFIDGSRVHYEFYGADYTKQITFLYLQELKALSLDGNTATNITCNGVPRNCYGYSFWRNPHTPME